MKILDADDSFVTEHLKEYLAFLSAVMADVVFNDYSEVTSLGKVSSTRHYGFDFRQSESIQPILDYGDQVFMHGIAYRTSLLKMLNYRQTEGICYTDGEWCAIPFSKVNSCAYFSNTLYLYLVGRDGQSVDVHSLAHNFPMHLQVLVRVLDYRDQFLSVSASLNQQYMTKWVKLHLGMLYNIIAFKLPYARVRTALHDLDAIVRTRVPSEYEKSGELYFSHSVHLRYLWLLRQYPKFSILLVFFIRRILLPLQDVYAMLRSPMVREKRM